MVVMSGEEHTWHKYGLWREYQKKGGASQKLEERVKPRWAIEQLIEEQLDRYQAHCNRALLPTRPKAVAQLLMPNWAPPHELASSAWFGDWRPSAILELLRALTLSSSSFSTAPLDLNAVERLLSQLIHEVRIEETVLDEEMAEIQATCILHLPFSPIRTCGTGATALASVLPEFKKMDRVITKAQQLRSKLFPPIS